MSTPSTEPEFRDEQYLVLVDDAARVIPSD
jgi:hypothetical protein